MADVGGVTCEIINGRASFALKLTVQTWTVPGFDGHGAQTVGKQGPPAAFSAIKFGTLTTLKTWVQAVEALQGTIVTINNSDGEAFNKIMLTEIQTAFLQRVTGIIGVSGGGGFTHKGTIQISGFRIAED